MDRRPLTAGLAVIAFVASFAIAYVVLRGAVGDDSGASRTPVAQIGTVPATPESIHPATGTGTSASPRPHPSTETTVTPGTGSGDGGGDGGGGTNGGGGGDGVAPPSALHIVRDYIPWPATRQQEMIAYCRRHYGDATLLLRPKVVVLHYTAGGTAQGAHALFSADRPNNGELPGVVAHFVVDKDGTVYQELPLDVRGRHAVGLNQVSIGIEFVQDAIGTHASEQAILARTAQATAGARLVAWLQRRYGIADNDVIGHAYANDSPYFKDLEGWRNSHSDWQRQDVAAMLRLAGRY
jgi:N-acetylmuramoyl-L-alanine amidase